MELNNVLGKSYNYLDSLIVSIKNSIYDVFIELVDEEEVGCFVYESQNVNNIGNPENVEINVEHETLPILLGESSNEIDVDEEIDVHNTAFIQDNTEIDCDDLDDNEIDWNDPRNYAYYDPHDDCEEYPSFLNNHYGSYGSNYDGGYDSY
jgi:hypothetical protein